MQAIHQCSFIFRIFGGLPSRDDHTAGPLSLADTSRGIQRGRVHDLRYGIQLLGHAASASVGVEGEVTLLVPDHIGDHFVLDAGLLKQGNQRVACAVKHVLRTKLSTPI